MNQMMAWDTCHDHMYYDIFLESFFNLQNEETYVQSTDLTLCQFALHLMDVNDV